MGSTGRGQLGVSEIKTDEWNIQLQPSLNQTFSQTSDTSSRSQTSELSSSQTSSRSTSTTNSASDYTDDEEENRDLDPWGMGDLSFAKF